ncbi:MAG: oligopeptidase B [Myxococcota bacterium]|jgi:oligopeptidase B
MAPEEETMRLLPDVVPPLAEQKPVELTLHGHTRMDPWFWLRDDDRTAVPVLDYLRAENTYTEAVLNPLKPLQTALFEEIKGRIKKDDRSVPVRMDNYWYYSRYEAGLEHPIYCRRPGRAAYDESAPESILLDINELAKPHAYYSVAAQSVSQNEQLLAFAEDTVSRRIYSVRVKNLATGEILDDVMAGGNGSFAWAADNRHLFYVKREEGTLRSHQIWRHELGCAQATDVLIFEESDETFWLSVRRSKSKAYVFIEVHSTLVTETLFVDATAPLDDFQMVLPREHKHEYRVWHHGDSLYVRTNHDAVNFRLMRVQVSRLAEGKLAWSEVIAHRDDVLLTSIEVFDRFLVVAERVEALRSLRVLPFDGQPEHTIEFEEPLRCVTLHRNPSFDTTVLRFGYSSPITPPSVYDYDLVTRERSLLKRDEVLGGYDPSDYETERRWCVARDGERIPVSICWRKGARDDGPGPLYQYAYGSYGHSMDPSFVPSRISLLDRGLVVATAHVRGGQEMGRRWYEEGKLEKKLNTFNDFIDVTEFLVREGYAAPDQVVAAGGSAGGMLMGGIANMRPELYRAIHAAVPFVDCVSTMLDDTIPLTTFEYDEWGNPNIENFYHYMMRYSPYDNVVEQAFPHLIVTTGLHDSQVQYWEPAKWVAKLRACVTNNALIVLDTDMDTGHGGATGRFKRYEQTAKEFALLLYTLGIDE